MPSKKEGICQMFGESSCGARESEQDTDRGAQVFERTLLSEGCSQLRDDVLVLGKTLY